MVEQTLLDKGRQTADCVLDLVIGVDATALKEINPLFATKSGIASVHAAPEVLRAGGENVSALILSCTEVERTYDASVARLSALVPPLTERKVFSAYSGYFSKNLETSCKLVVRLSFGP